MFGGIGVAVLGGVLLATAGEHRARPPKDLAPTPAPPREVAALYPTQAVGMAVAQYMMGLHGTAKPATLLQVDDKYVVVHINERHAELWNLRIRAGSDEPWRIVGACYEYKHVWTLTAVGSTLQCPRQ